MRPGQALHVRRQTSWPRDSGNERTQHRGESGPGARLLAAKSVLGGNQERQLETSDKQRTLSANEKVLGFGLSQRTSKTGRKRRRLAPNSEDTKTKIAGTEIRPARPDQRRPKNKQARGPRAGRRSAAEIRNGKTKSLSGRPDQVRHWARERGTLCTRKSTKTRESRRATRNESQSGTPKRTTRVGEDRNRQRWEPRKNSGFDPAAKITRDQARLRPEDKTEQGTKKIERD
jgi:hypothetical protein